MSEPENIKDDEIKIIEQIAALARLLGMIPSDDTITVNEPGTQNSMELSEWLSDTRNSFHELATLIDRTLDLQLH